jgi:hypothetical protein
MRTALPLFVAMLASLPVRAETPSAADFDARAAGLSSVAAEEQRLAAAKWLLANSDSEHAPRAIPALEKSARGDPASGVRRAAVAALVRIVNRHDVPCPLGLAAALRDPVDEVRWEASVLPGPFKRRLAPGALAALIAAVGDDRAGVRSNALIHLADAAGKDPKARAVIGKAMEDKDLEVRFTAHRAWFTATGDLAALLRYVVRVREEPAAVLSPLPAGSEGAKVQQSQRNLFVIGSAVLIADWAEERPEDLAVALLALLGHESAAMRRGAADLMGVVARRAEKRDTPGAAPFEPPLSYLDPGAGEKPPKPRPSKAFAVLLARDAGTRLREVGAKDPDETVRSAARRALERWAEVPVPLDIRPRELKR